MAIFEGIRCDICGKQKGEVNHWYVLVVNEKQSIFSIFTWAEAEECKILDASNIKHSCGEGCTTRAFTTWSAERRILDRLQDAGAIPQADGAGDVPESDEVTA
jgi:hypothetical protein